jgi:outer membrane protein assembly factor BamB
MSPAHAGSPACGTDPPPEVTDDENGWPLPNGDYANSRAQLDSPIDASTIGQLQPAWSYDVPGDALFGNLTTNPVVVGETVVVGALDGSIHTIDLDDGASRWSAPRALTQFGPSGAAVGWGKVFGLGGTSTVVAHDLATGAEVWSEELGVAPGNQIDMQPTVVGDCVFVATQGLLPGSRGTLFALDEATGDVVWSFETVPDDFWGNPEVNHGGGSWYPPAIDVASGTVYWGTSNPWPSPGAPGFPAGTSRPGDNLYTNSALSFDLADGSLQWFNQAFQHDIFDRDMVLTQLVETDDGGSVLVHTGKGGIVRGLDPATGAERWSTPVGMHENDDLTTFEESVTVMPGVLGGVETPPAAADGIIYVVAVNAPTTYESPEQTFSLDPQLNTHPSSLVALDAQTGEVVFDVDVPGDSLGAATVVNDLVLTSTFEGLLLAYDRLTGAEVWRYEAPGFVNGSPAVVDDTILWPVSGTSPSQLLALRLPRPAAPTSIDSVQPRFTG